MIGCAAHFTMQPVESVISPVLSLKRPLRNSKKESKTVERSVLGLRSLFLHHRYSGAKAKVIPEIS